MTLSPADVVAEARVTGFSGVVAVEREGVPAFAAGFGLADRAHAAPNTLATRFDVASGAKTFTALTVCSLVERGDLTLATRARELLGDDLPLVDDAVTVEQLLAHRSGIGDYADESDDGDVDTFVLPVPVSQLVTAEDYLRVVDGFPQQFAPGTRFAYCNGGYVVLALLAERATGRPFAELVHDLVCEPANLRDTGFVPTDRPIPGHATGYVEGDDGWRTNWFTLPSVGCGDGGISTTIADVARLWHALDAGTVVSHATLTEMWRPRGTDHDDDYGLGFWLRPARGVVYLEGMDAGVSFRSLHDPDRRLSATTISNTTDGAWPVTRVLEAALGL